MEKKCDRCHSSQTIKHGYATRWKGGRKYKVPMYLCNHCGHQGRRE